MKYLALSILLLVAAALFKSAWWLWRMPDAEWREIEERRERKRRDREAVRFLLGQGEGR